MRKILHFKKELSPKLFKDWTNHFFQEPKELGDLINKGNLIHKFLPRQTDIDKILEVIHRNVLKGTHLPVENKEIQAGYLHGSYFKDIYLSQNRLPSSKAVTRRIEALAEKYILLDPYFLKLYQKRKQQFLQFQKLVYIRS